MKREGVSIAYSIQEELEFDAEVTVWPQDIFRARSTAMESLQSALLRFDFAVFVVSPDDHLSSRGREWEAPRDNVIFELGLFIGRLGRERVFFVVPRNALLMHLPSDLLGVTALSFDPTRSDGNIRASLGAACNQLRQVFTTAARLAPQGPAKSASMRDDREPTSALKTTIENAASRIRKASWPSNVLFADIDGFTSINKWFGVEVCDRVIETVEGIFTASLRNYFWTRFGGDQFIACIGGVGHKDSMNIGEDLVRAVSNCEWASIAPGLYVTMSAGHATSMEEESVTNWVVRAIHGSILAKKAGGNRISEAPLRLGRAVSRAWSDYAS